MREADHVQSFPARDSIREITVRIFTRKRVGPPNDMPTPHEHTAAGARDGCEIVTLRRKVGAGLQPAGVDCRRAPSRRHWVALFERTLTAERTLRNEHFGTKFGAGYAGPIEQSRSLPARGGQMLRIG